MKAMRTAIWTAGICISLGGPVYAGSVTLLGPTTTAGTYSPAALQALGTANPANVVNFNGLTGISVWGLLGAVDAGPTSTIFGAITTTSAPGTNAKNSLNRYYVVGTGDHAAHSVVSLGQIDPGFGNPANPPFVAYQSAGGGLLDTPQLIVPNGPPGSSLTGLTSLQLLSYPAIPSQGGGLSTSVTLSGNVKSPSTYTLSTLQSNFTPVQVPGGGETYTGIPLATFLNTSAADVNTQIVVGQATDGFEVVFSLGELTADLSDILAYASTGADFTTGGDGVARTITPTDNKHGRWISNLQNLQVLDWSVGLATTDSHDFNGDGISDIASRGAVGNVTIRLTDDGQILETAGLPPIPPNLRLMGQRDFNGDGNADLLWRDPFGNVAISFLNGTEVAGSTVVGWLPLTWIVAGTGDFNGDHKGDILWQDFAGNLQIWLLDGAKITATAELGNIGHGWTVAGTGDFDGNGTADILLRSVTGDIAIWFTNGTEVTSKVSIGNQPNAWMVAGTGDFNGDGMFDILWRDYAGQIAIWFINGSQVQQATVSGEPNAGLIQDTGDYNGDGKSDILLRNAFGQVTIWFMNGSEINSTASVGNIPFFEEIQTEHVD
jgi:hypothetical protein